MQQFSHPEIGKTVEVILNTTKPAGEVAYHVPATETFTGDVVANEKWMDPGTFCITTGLPSRYNFPVRNLLLKHVDNMSYVSGEKVEKKEVKDPGSIERIVIGSKGDKYVVKKVGKTWSCTCIAGQFNRPCKHIKSVKQELV